MDPTDETDISTTEAVQEKTKEVAAQAQERVGEIAEQARGGVSSQVNQRSTTLGRQIGSGANDVRSVAEALRGEGKDKPAQLAEQAAGHVERVGQWLESSDGDKIIHDIEDFSRRNPWAVALGGLALGFAASRMLKASSGKRYAAVSAAKDAAS